MQLRIEKVKNGYNLTVEDNTNENSDQNWTEDEYVFEKLPKLMKAIKVILNDAGA